MGSETHHQETAGAEPHAWQLSWSLLCEYRSLFSEYRSFGVNISLFSLKRHFFCLNLGLICEERFRTSGFPKQHRGGIYDSSCKRVFRTGLCPNMQSSTRLLALMWMVRMTWWCMYTRALFLLGPVFVGLYFTRHVIPGEGALAQMHTWKSWRRQCSHNMKYLRFSPQKGPRIEGSCANACMKNVADAHVTCSMYTSLRRRAWARSYRAFPQIHTLKTS